MISKIIKLFSGRHYRKFVQYCTPIIAKINQFDESYKALSDDALTAKTEEFKKRYENGETLDQLLPEAFAVVKNAARRLCGRKIIVSGHELEWNMVHYDVQMIGGIALHEKKIAEMATGEGKTLVATLPLYLNSLTGRNCQLVTVNDYLAKRDSEWNGYLYKFLGLTVGCIQNQMDSEERKEAYGCNITYGTSSEFGFDYLRDNGMATSAEDQVQRDHYFCIVDEVDSILIDEARTPLIISGPVEDEREAPFLELKGIVAQLVQLQAKLCNRLASEASEGFEQGGEALEKALPKLLQVKMGMPKNRLLFKLMENGAFRTRFEKYELEMNADYNRTKLYDLKEELYFSIDEKQHQSDLSEKGRNTLSPNNPDAFLLPDLPEIFSELEKRQDLSKEAILKEKQKVEEIFAKRSEEIHCLSQLLRAYCLYERDVEYVVQDGKIVIIDENTGRAMPGRRWSEGLHQAVEAKEGVLIEKETKTFATITIQNYFRLYDKLAGMTGTAETEAQEFYDIYKLTVVSIPTHKPCIRIDLNDVIYKTRREKYNAVISEIEAAHKQGQPVLVGTTSVENSEVISKMLKRAHVPHAVLNAKFHAQEADIVALAGQQGAVTIATNMAGRGTDIKLGAGVFDLGGLYVVGTERHDSRRVDRQLRGRCARQGDKGKSKFFISLEDNLMRLFANAGPVARILESSFSEGESLEHPLLNKSISTAQKKVEEQNYMIRKRLLQYDDVLNKQREVIYGLRNDTIRGPEPKSIIFEMVHDEIGARLDEIEKSFKSDPDGEEVLGFLRWANLHFPIAIKVEEIQKLSLDQVHEYIVDAIQKAYAEKESVEQPDQLKDLERLVVIRAIDKNWQDHLTEMEDLRRSVGLRGYGQKDPLNEYKSEAYIFFEELMKEIRNAVCMNLFRAATSIDSFNKMAKRISIKMKASGPQTSESSDDDNEDTGKKRALPKLTIKPRETTVKVGRNDPCPCGSGKKYKKCCGVGLE